MEGQSRARFKVCLKSAKNLCLGHRFFDEIRQNPPILLHFQAKGTDSLQKSGATRARGAIRAHGAPGEKPNLPAISTHKNTHQQAIDLLVGIFLTH